jgi:predicted MFS family arabinose efflux permease
MAVDRGRADGRTGRYQASQWFCLYASGVVTGTAGGALSTGGGVRIALMVGALASALMLAVAALGVREPPREPGRNDSRAPRGAPAWRGVLAVAGFLAVGSFSPFASSALLHVHMTATLGYSEQFFGHTASIFAGASMTAAAVYGAFGRRLPVRALGFASVALGALGNLAYLGLNGHGSAVVVTVIAGLASMTAGLIQLELAARACPPAATGTVFASFMAVSNLSTSLATWLAGRLYEAAGSSRDRFAAFHALVLAGAACLSLGGLLVPLLPDDRSRPLEGEETGD